MSLILSPTSDMSVKSSSSRIPTRRVPAPIVVPQSEASGAKADDSNPSAKPHSIPKSHRESISIHSDTVSSIDLGGGSEVIISPLSKTRLSTASTLMEYVSLSPSVRKGIQYARESPNRHDAVHVYRRDDVMYCEMFTRSESVEVMTQVEDMSSVRFGLDRIKFEAQILANMQVMTGMMYSQMAKSVDAYLKNAEHFDDDDAVYESLPESVKYRIRSEPDFLSSPGRYQPDLDMFNRIVMGLLAYRSMVRE